MESQQASGGVIVQFPENCVPDRGSTREPSRAELANEISSYLLRYLHGYKIPTYFIEMRGPVTMLVREAEVYPFFVKIWNTAGGAWARHLGLRQGSELAFPVPELYSTAASAAGSLVNDFHLYAAGAITPGELRSVHRLASKTNAVLRVLFARRGLTLDALTLRFGKAGEQILLCNQLTPATCLVSDAEAGTGRRGRGGRGMAGPAELRLMRDRLIGVPEAEPAL